MNTKSRPIIYTDLDGTLLDSDSYSFAPARSCMERLAALQIPLIPVTSKTFAEVAELRSKLRLIRPFIVENGAAVYIPCGYFGEQPEGTQRIVVGKEQYWLRTGSKLIAESDARVAAIYQDFSQHFTLLSAMSNEQLIAVTGLSAAGAQAAKARKFSDPIFWIGDADVRHLFVDCLQALDYQVLHGGRFLHVLEPGFDKGAALDWLTAVYCKDQRRSRYLVVGCGDSANDLPMMARTDVAIFLGAGVPGMSQLLAGVDLRTHPESGPGAWAEMVNRLLDELGLP